MFAVAVIAILPMMLHPSRAQAAGAGIHPDCVRMGKNQRQCTCALATGGTIEPSGRWRYYNTPRYTDCMREKGWM